MSTDSRTVSVLIATYNRPGLCARAVRSVFAAAPFARELDLEIVAGVNGLDKETSNVLRELRKSAPNVRLNIVEFDERLTPAACRNRLLGHTHGDWIYFLDDDAYVDPDFFTKFSGLKDLDAFAAVGGPNLNPPGADAFQTTASRALASRFATYFSSARYVPLGEARVCSEEALILCNLFVRREVLREDSFLDSLVCGEENWMLLELKKRGHHFAYDPDLYVWHERRPDLASFVRQVFKYGFGRGQIFRKRPSGLRPAHVLPLICVAYTCALICATATDLDLSGLWWTPFPVYAALCLGFAYVQRSPGSAFLFPVIHVSYGTGLFWGIFCG